MCFSLLNFCLIIVDLNQAIEYQIREITSVYLLGNRCPVGETAGITRQWNPSLVTLKISLIIKRVRHLKN